MFENFIRSVSQRITDVLSRGQSVWVVLSQVEGEDSNYPPDKRITPEILRDVAEHYDPSHRRAPVVQAVEGITGRAHEKGELNPPVAWVEELSFDGMNLWGRVRDVGGQFARFVEKGLVRGSVFIWPGRAENEGHWVLRHFALIAGQLAGTAGIPHMDEFFSAVEYGREAEERSVLESGNYFARSYGFEEEEEMSKEENDALLRAFKDELPGALKGVLGEVKTEIVNEVTGKVDERVRSLEAQLAEVRGLAEGATKNAAEAKIRSAVEALSKEGKIMPAEIDSEVSSLLRASATEVEDRLKLIAGRPAMDFGPEPKDKNGKGSEGLSEVARAFTIPNRTFDKEELAYVRDLMAEAGGDPKKFEQLAFARDEQN